jgi:hypothetical protein
LTGTGLWAWQPGATKVNSNKSLNFVCIPGVNDSNLRLTAAGAEFKAAAYPVGYTAA